MSIFARHFQDKLNVSGTPSDIRSAYRKIGNEIDEHNTENALIQRSEHAEHLNPPQLDEFQSPDSDGKFSKGRLLREMKSILVSVQSTKGKESAAAFDQDHQQLPVLRPSLSEASQPFRVSLNLSNSYLSKENQTSYGKLLDEEVSRISPSRLLPKTGSMPQDNNSRLRPSFSPSPKMIRPKQHDENEPSSVLVARRGEEAGTASGSLTLTRFNEDFENCAADHGCSASSSRGREKHLNSLSSPFRDPSPSSWLTDSAEVQQMQPARSRDPTPASSSTCLPTQGEVASSCWSTQGKPLPRMPSYIACIQDIAHGLHKTSMEIEQHLASLESKLRCACLNSQEFGQWKHHLEETRALAGKARIFQGELNNIARARKKADAKVRGEGFRSRYSEGGESDEAGL